MPAAQPGSAGDVAPSAHTSDPSAVSDDYVANLTGYRSRFSPEDAERYEAIDRRNAVIRQANGRDPEEAAAEAALQRDQQRPLDSHRQRQESKPAPSPEEMLDVEEELEARRALESPQETPAGEPEGDEGDELPEWQQQYESPEAVWNAYQNTSREAQRMAEELREEREERRRAMELLADLSQRGISQERGAPAPNEPRPPEISSEQFFEDPMNAMRSFVEPFVQSLLEQSRQQEQQRTQAVFEGQRRLNAAFTEIETANSMTPDQQQELRAYLQDPRITSLIRTGDLDGAAAVAHAFYVRDHGTAPKSEEPPKQKAQQRYVAGSARGKGARSKNVPEPRDPGARPRISRQGLNAMSDAEFEAVVEAVSGRPLTNNLRLSYRGF